MIELTVRDVYRRILRTYGTAPAHRDMLIHKDYSAHTHLGAVFFSINGSPPKGYAIYQYDHSFLLIVDAWGKTKRYREVKIIDLDDFSDDCVLPRPESEN